MSDVQELTRIVHRMRSVLESLAPNPWPGFKEFPKESCTVACRLLALYLLECGLGPVACVSGRRPDGKPGGHLWLRKNGLILDITADQFEGEVNRPVTVAVESESDWHAHLAKELPDEVICDHEWAKKFRELESWNAFYRRIADRMRE
jgi:hypothetical protein